MINNTTELDANTARAIAQVVAAIRPAWHPTATSRVLWQLRDQPGPLVAVAAVLAALDPDLDTPAGIAWRDRPHWQHAQDATAADSRGPDPDELHRLALRRIRAHERRRKATPEARARILQPLRDAGILRRQARECP